MTATPSVPSLYKHLGDLDPLQIQIWRRMTPAQRLGIAFQAYQLALDAVRLTERQRHPDLSESELAWRVTRRTQGDQSLRERRTGIQSRGFAHFIR
ncbi:MAG: hypothetical protein GY759_02005 [Chloroflexi bacterium]|nr:hypothetical protein [Chloroflexota bacterium]